MRLRSRTRRPLRVPVLRRLCFWSASGFSSIALQGEKQRIRFWKVVFLVVMLVMLVVLVSNITEYISVMFPSLVQHCIIIIFSCHYLLSHTVVTIKLMSSKHVCEQVQAQPMSTGEETSQNNMPCPALESRMFHVSVVLSPPLRLLCHHLLCSNTLRTLPKYTSEEADWPALIHAVACTCS